MLFSVCISRQRNKLNHQIFFPFHSLCFSSFPHRTIFFVFIFISKQMFVLTFIAFFSFTFDFNISIWYSHFFLQAFLCNRNIHKFVVSACLHFKDRMDGVPSMLCMWFQLQAKHIFFGSPFVFEEQKIHEMFSDRLWVTKTPSEPTCQSNGIKKI